jgi:hypothetical protein
MKNPDFIIDNIGNLQNYIVKILLAGRDVHRILDHIKPIIKVDESADKEMDVYFSTIPLKTQKPIENLDPINNELAELANQEYNIDQEDCTYHGQV